MVEEDLDQSAIAVAALAVPPEPSPAEVLDIGRGSTLLYRHEQYKRTEEVHSVTPEWANHQQVLARIEADTRIKEAELTHLAPVRTMVRPLWAAIVALGTLATYAMYLSKDYLAGVALGGLAIAPIVDAIARKVKKPTA